MCSLWIRGKDKESYDIDLRVGLKESLGDRACNCVRRSEPRAEEFNLGDLCPPVQ